jgi:hypothetical protein
VVPGCEFGAIGPLTVHPAAQGGVGRRLLPAALDQALLRGLTGVRLVQSPTHLRSLALYASMGFEAPEPLVLVTGPARPRSAEEGTVRPESAHDVLGQDDNDDKSARSKRPVLQASGRARR